MITTAIARADWITMDADHEATVTAPPSLFFKEASQTESSSCSWLGLRDECLDLLLKKCQKKKANDCSHKIKFVQYILSAIRLILAIDVRPCLSVMCYQVPTRQLQLPSQNQHTKMAKVLCGDRRKGKMAREEEYKSKQLCFAPSLTLSPPIPHSESRSHLSQVSKRM